MPIKIKTPNLNITHQATEMAMERAKTVILNVMSYVAEEGVTDARNVGNYVDRTGNLRSSIGYVITDGKSITNIGEQKQYKEGADGLSKSKQLLKEYASRHEGDLSLHVVAGMNYADYVERIYHRKVLSPARVKIDYLLPRRLEQSGIKVKS